MVRRKRAYFLRKNNSARIREGRKLGTHECPTPQKPQTLNKRDSRNCTSNMARPALPP
jgi:hypothetical protein